MSAEEELLTTMSGDENSKTSTTPTVDATTDAEPEIPNVTEPTETSNEIERIEATATNDPDFETTNEVNSIETTNDDPPELDPVDIPNEDSTEIDTQTDPEPTTDPDSVDASDIFSQDSTSAVKNTTNTTQSEADTTTPAPSSSDLFDALLNDNDLSSLPEIASQGSSISLSKEQLMDNVEENMRALQAEDDSPTDENDPTEFVQVNNKDAEPMDLGDDPIGDGEDDKSTDPIEETNKDNEESIIPDMEREITQAEKDAATSAQSNKSNGDSSEPMETDEGSVDAPTVALTDESSNGEVEFNVDLMLNQDEGKREVCKQCGNDGECFVVYGKDNQMYFCNESCCHGFFKVAKRTDDGSVSDTEGSGGVTTKFKVSRDKNAIREPLVYVRKCFECKKTLNPDERNLTWECMEFCNEDCLGKFQNQVGAKCANCKDAVPFPSLGKYCVRFGYDIRQFCCSACLEDFKKGLKVCSYCQKDISSGQEGFLAPVGDKGQFKDFCTQTCMKKYDRMSSNHAPKKQIAQCAVCSNEKLIRLEIEVEGVDHKLCSEPCFVAFKFANNVSPEQCRMCQKYFEQTTLDYSIYFDDSPQHFCCKTCQNVFIISNRKIVPCQWCKVKKYNFDMINKDIGNEILKMCSIHCLSLHQVSINAIQTKSVKCDQCSIMTQAQYHLTMSDATIRNFCCYPCVMAFQNQFSKSPITIANSGNPVPIPQQTEPIRNVAAQQGAVPTGQPKRTYGSRSNRDAKSRKNQHPLPTLPIITSVHSLASDPGTPTQTNGPSRTQKSSKISTGPPPPLTPVAPPSTTSKSSQKLPPLKPIQTTSLTNQMVSTGTSTNTGTSSSSQVQPQTDQSISATSMVPPKPKYVQQFMVKYPPVPQIKNKSTMCKPNMHTKGVSFKPHMTSKETQTDEKLSKTIIIPVPVPIYVPTPMALYSQPFPVAVPFPLPVPIPIFIPTTRNSATGIMKEIKKIQVKIPTDPFEAELLMMAEMVAGDKKVEHTDSESDDDDHGGGGNEGAFSPEAVDTSNTFGDDMLQMALKMATELDEPAVDLEGALTANTITASQSTHETHDDDDDQLQHHHSMMTERGGPTGRGTRKRQGGRTPRGSGGKRGRRISGHDMPMMPPPQQQTPQPPPEPVEKPDANMCLKYTFGVNAWKQWVTTKNAELEKSTLPLKPFKSEILQLTADELNYSLCLFVKEVRKPNGSEYAPDTIYYLCLGKFFFLESP